MISLTKDGVTYYFEYDNEGRRVKKTAGDKVTTYYYSGDLLVAETCGNQSVFYLYDNASIIGYELDGVRYCYDKNIQGDIVAVYNESGEKLVSYTYDAWGNATANYADGAEKLYNPFGYRGYYYDYDVDLYYLGTRYYDTATGRFLSPDTTAVLTATPMALTHKNLYAYCDNNPITRVDHGGEFWEDVVVDVYECERFDVGGLGGPLGSSAYNTYAIYSKTASYNAKFGGYYHGTVSSGITNPGRYYVPGAVSVTDDMVNPTDVNSSTIRTYTVNPKQSGTNSNSSHRVGTGSATNNIVPGGSYTKLDTNGNIYSYTQFDKLGRQTMRIDFQGRAHNGVIPHIHLYVYPSQGGRVQYSFDMNWNLLK